MAKSAPKSAAGAGEGADPLLGDLARNWGWTLALGLLFLVLGLVGVAMVLGLTYVTIFFIGVLLVAGGIAQVLETVKCKGWKGTLFHLAIAALYLAAGLAVFYDPVMLSKAVAIGIGAVLAAVGLARILIARQLRADGAGWRWMVLSGLLAIALGVMIWVGWPLSGLFAIALFVAVEMLLQGSSYVSLALTARRRAVA